MTLGGHIGHAGQWRKFDKKWGRALRDNQLSHFHTKDFVGRTKEFRGWGEKRGVDFLARLSAIVNRNILCSFSVRLTESDYKTYYRREGEPLKKIALDSQYGVCLRICLIFLPQFIVSRFGDTKPRFHIVMESGHRNYNDAVRIFDTYKKQAPPPLPSIAGTLTFADKKECCGVQAADYFAYSTYLVEQQPEVEVTEFSTGGNLWENAEKHCTTERLALRLNATPTVLRDLRENLSVEREIMIAQKRSNPSRVQASW